jgi:hypothetical protein
MGPDRFVALSPGLDQVARLAAGSEPLGVQALVAQTPLKLSFVPFCQGLPGSIWTVSIRFGTPG